MGFRHGAVRSLLFASKLKQFQISSLELLLRAVQQSPELPALICNGEQLSYRQFGNAVYSLADVLAQQNVRSARVATLLGNSFEMAVTWFAVQLAGAQLVPLNPLYTGPELDFMLRDAQPVCIVHDAGLSQAVLTVICAIPGSECLSINAQDTARHCQIEFDPASYPMPDPQSLALLQYTGGTSGKPKGVNLTHAAVAINIAQREHALPTRNRAERVLVVTPLYHSYASTMGLHLAVNCQGCLVIATGFDAAQVLRLIETKQISIFSGSPTIFNALLAHKNFSQTDFSSLQYCSSGSAALAEDTLRRWESATGCIICEGYGQTEAGPVLSYNPINGVRKIGTVGPALPQTELQIVDLINGNEVLAMGKIGEIRARGPQLMTGYRNRPQETADTLRDGWLYTGDIGELDAQGYLTILDRKKDMVIVSGFNVYPREIEEVLFEHEQISEAAVVGAPHERRGETLVAFIVATENTLSEQTVLSFLATRLTRYKLPKDIRMVSSLPKTGVGKVDKLRLKQDARA